MRQAPRLVSNRDAERRTRDAERQAACRARKKAGSVVVRIVVERDIQELLIQRKWTSEQEIAQGKLGDVIADLIHCAAHDQLRVNDEYLGPDQPVTP